MHTHLVLIEDGDGQALLRRVMSRRPHARRRRPTLPDLALATAAWSVVVVVVLHVIGETS